MHVLTKIFIVLVSLLAVLLVPLVVVYAHNENSYKDRWQAAQAQYMSSQNALTTAQATAEANRSQLDAQLTESIASGRQLRTERDRLQADLRSVQSRADAAEQFQARMESILATLSETGQANQEMLAGLLQETTALRSDVVTAQREAIELEEALRDAQNQLEVAIDARRQLEEELQRLSEAHATAQDRLSRYNAQYGALSDTATGRQRVQATISLSSTVTQVRRSQDEVLIDLNAGSRDGVKQGWVMTLSDGGTYIGDVEIIRVDPNISVGRVLGGVNPQQVKVGQRLSISPGQ